MTKENLEIQEVTINKFTEGGAVTFGELTIKFTGAIRQIREFKGDLLEFCIKHFASIKEDN